MKIIENSIKDLTDKLNYFAGSLSGCNYNVEFQLKKFAFKNEVENNIFSLKDLQFLYPHEDVQGDLYVSGFSNVKKQLKDALSFFGYPTGCVEHTSDQKIIESREYVFWSIVKKYFDISSTNVIELMAPYDSYFGYYVMWGFCFIMLNENSGLVLSGRGFD